MKYLHPRTAAGPRRDEYKEKFWRGVLRRFAASGQTVRGFCAAHQLAEPSFYAWRRALAERDAADLESAAPTSPCPPPAPAFVPVHLADASNTMSSPIEVVLAGGRCLRLRGPVDRVVLTELVAALEGLVPASPAAS